MRNKFILTNKWVMVYFQLIAHVCCRNPYDYCDDDEDEEDKIKPMKLDIDLGLSAYANARK